MTSLSKSAWKSTAHTHLQHCYWVLFVLLLRDESRVQNDCLKWEIDTANRYKIAALRAGAGVIQEGYLGV